MVAADPTVDLAQQMLTPFDRDAALQDSGVTSLVEFALHKKKGLGATCEPSGLHLVRRQHIIEEVVEVGRPSVDQRAELCRWVLFKLHDFRARWSRWLVSPRAQGGWPYHRLVSAPHSRPRACADRWRRRLMAPALSRTLLSPARRPPH